MINLHLMLDHLNLKDTKWPFQDSKFTNRPPMFEFFGKDPPHIRQRLSDETCSLGAKFPALRALRSCDLLRGSWFSVAWFALVGKRGNRATHTSGRNAKIEVIKICETFWCT